MIRWLVEGIVQNSWFYLDKILDFISCIVVVVFKTTWSLVEIIEER